MILIMNDYRFLNNLDKLYYYFPTPFKNFIEHEVYFCSFEFLKLEIHSTKLQIQAKLSSTIVLLY